MIYIIYFVGILIMIAVSGLLEWFYVPIHGKEGKKLTAKQRDAIRQGQGIMSIFIVFWPIMLPLITTIFFLDKFYYMFETLGGKIGIYRQEK